MTASSNTDGVALKPLSVCLINPRFEPSFWGYDFALPLMGGDKRCWTATGALPALAALAPDHCRVELLDENVEPIYFDDLVRFDVIGVTGMVVQGPRMRQILGRLKGLPAVVAVGGPYVSVAEEQFVDLCDVRFIGEAEETWPDFLSALAAGAETRERYEQAQKTDMTKVPAPRYDLMKAGRYVMASLQFSRGCPFTCEFCDIITIFGRRPRLKTVEQMLNELEVIRREGFRLCFLVDDNLIGNKGEAKKLLAAVARWQREHGFPLQFFAEASINLADDPELLGRMVEANVRQVFVGIESPRRESLAETKKIQNIRGDSLLAKVQRIRDAGLVVQAGFIVGFDSDDEAIFDDQFAFIQEAGLANAVVAILAPIPTTPLYDRLKAAGRLDFAHPDVPFQPQKMSREALKAGYDDLMRRLYEPDAYFERLFRGYAGSPAFRQRRQAMDAAIAGPRTRKRDFIQVLGGIRQAVGLWRAMAAAGLRRRLGAAYAQIWLTRNLPLGRERIAFGAFVGMCVVHWHLFNIANRAEKGKFGNVQDAVAEPRDVADMAA